jgi:predicted RNA-binding protein with PIN domain
MSLQFIIDGYNTARHASFKSPGKINDTALALESVIRSKRLCGSGKNPVMLVFDGYPPNPQLKYEQGMTIVFSRQQSADETIKKLVEAARNPKQIVVVSDDKEIRSFVKGCGAISWGVEEFLGKGERRSIRQSAGDPIKPDLSYTQMDEINKEFRKLWL